LTNRKKKNWIGQETERRRDDYRRVDNFRPLDRVSAVHFRSNYFYWTNRTHTSHSAYFSVIWILASGAPNPNTKPQKYATALTQSRKYL